MNFRPKPSLILFNYTIPEQFTHNLNVQNTDYNRSLTNILQELAVISFCEMSRISKSKGIMKLIYGK